MPENEALAHSGECEAARSDWHSSAGLLLGCGPWLTEMKSVSASPRVEEKLLEAFRSQTSATSTNTIGSR